MGEMLLGHYKENLPLVIIRPTMISSTYKQPFPGWIEGLRTVDGTIIGFGKGKLKCLPAKYDAIIDLIPADMVVDAMIMAMIGLGYPFINKNGKALKVSKCTILDTSAKFRRYIAIKYALPLKVLQLVNWLLWQCYKDICIDYDRKIKFVLRVVELYKPYMCFKGIFDDTNTEKLRMTMRESGMEMDSINFDPKVKIPGQEINHLYLLVQDGEKQGAITETNHILTNRCSWKRWVVVWRRILGPLVRGRRLLGGISCGAFLP
ncbi:hypothetical protein Ddye_025366 [Dipteronia dyeriana]|uniref:Fatty acyl-CoA reductase n=1 Tax=Dipteronia dyeriana TaxID=168575 RepID=A0AAD9TX54_9ROSI|nr:hypothetical protein Ddye_025366 [Dipteronia dyeriana]